MYRIISNPQTRRFYLYDSKERIRKALYTYKALDITVPNPIIKSYMFWQYDHKDRIVRFGYMSRTEGREPVLEEYFKIAYNDKDEITYYEDNRGNIWQESWGMDLPFGEHLQKYMTSAQDRMQIIYDYNLYPPNSEQRIIFSPLFIPNNNTSECIG